MRACENTQDCDYKMVVNIKCMNNENKSRTLPFFYVVDHDKLYSFKSVRIIVVINLVFIRNFVLFLFGIPTNLLPLAFLWLTLLYSLMAVADIHFRSILDKNLEKSHFTGSSHFQKEEKWTVFLPLTSGSV